MMGKKQVFSVAGVQAKGRQLASGVCLRKNRKNRPLYCPIGSQPNIGRCEKLSKEERKNELVVCHSRFTGISCWLNPLSSWRAADFSGGCGNRGASYL
ncbi:MAG: hypothetical protein H7228_08860 [Polaromonas sp.]|nr:hypothetical protein [Polaromonas sp.]